MKLIRKYGINIYYSILAVDCLLILFNFNDERFFSKTLLVPLLTFMFYINTGSSKHLVSKRFVYAGLFFSWIGDIVSLFTTHYTGMKNENPLDLPFLLSMFLFACSFISYALLFQRMKRIKINNCQEAFIAGFAMTVVSAIVYVLLKNELGKYHLKIPAVVYMLVLGFMTVFAANLYQDKSKQNMTFQYFLPGVLLLSLSIALLAAYKLLIPDVRFMPIVIMILYGYGQATLMVGFGKYLKT